MLTRHNILVNKIRLRKYERCKVNAKSQCDFYDSLRSIQQKVEFAAICSQFELGLQDGRFSSFVPSSDFDFQGDIKSDSRKVGLFVPQAEKNRAYREHYLRSARRDINFDTSLFGDCLDLPL